MRVAGIMSGTSLDGIDVAIVDIAGRRFRMEAFRTSPYPAAVRTAILGVSNAATTTASISRLNFLLGELYAEAVIDACRAARIPLRSVDLIGCHGQTIYHEGEPAPVCGRRVGSTMQIGEAAVIAERTGIPVVSNFRPRDMAAGGKGAPLVPYVDYLLFADARRTRVALNIGGIANITVLPAGARPDQVVAFDTGPGNMVVDALVRHHTGGRKQYDAGGRIAAKGRVQRDLLNELLRDPYYLRRPPKTAGREQYGAELVDRLLQTGTALPDLIATATVLTAATVAQAVARFAPAPVHELIVSGGGAHNPQILAHLAAYLPEVNTATSSDFGIPVDAKEAIAFAVLAHETWRRRPANLQSATGARRAVILGDVTFGNP